MNKIAIIIPTRLDAKRLPNKPLKLINNKEMILHVYEMAKRSDCGDVYVATPDQKIIEIVNNQGGNAVKTAVHHQTGTDRVFEVFKEILKSKPNIIVNLQGDMPNISPEAIKDLVSYIEKKKCDIATLASYLQRDEIENENVVKVSVKEKLSLKSYSQALDFYRVNANLKHNLYHHVGIYAFTNEALLRYVSLQRSKLEIERKLEQLRAIEDNMNIHVGYIKSSPLSVDTNEDLINIKKIMENNEKK